MNTILNLWKNHGTKILGFAQITVAAIASVDGIFAPKTVKILMMASGLLTAWRGFVNSANQS